jgi:predicted dehydrogenase
MAHQTPASPAAGRELLLALVGTGRWGRCIARELAQVEGARIAFAVNRSGARPPELAPDVTLLPHWQPLFEGKRIDGVLVATPAAAHVAVVQAALESGVPVFVEKPLALDLAESLGCLDRAEALGLPFLVDHVLLFHPGIRLLFAAARAAGPIEVVRAEAGNRGPFRPDSDLLFDWGPHDLALTAALLGPQVQLRDARRLARERQEGGLFGESIEITLTGPAGEAVTLELSNLRERKWRRYALRAGGRWFSFEDDGAGAAVFRCEDELDGPRTAMAPLSGRALHNALSDFCTAVRVGQPTPEWTALARRVSELLEQARRALLARPFPVSAAP